MNILKAQAEQCAHHRKLVNRISRDRLCYSRVLDRANLSEWSHVFGNAEPSAAVELAKEMGYEASLLAAEKLKVVYSPKIICPDTGALQVSAGAQGHVAYDVFYRDGSSASHEIFWESDKEPLADADVMKLLAAYAQSRVFFKWHNEGDAILLNNKLFAHGRMPFRGKRKVAIIMGNAETHS